ncbi:hypothetical protein O6H91_02G153400 [Diphasiastrum complanatum]|uniref:Uncharacterized protein n=1 Tax=Diphasiastrum complanatum TaxID=34168 RepID=A0ACC2EM86_DIPCM|nr:hypothetical protein O6H91_02G153400 [Diphasiastrum complanatum]
MELSASHASGSAFTQQSSEGFCHTRSVLHWRSFQKRPVLGYGHVMQMKKLVSGRQVDAAQPLLRRIVALDAAQPFDYESRKREEMVKKNQLKIGLVGFGNFGQFLARRFLEQGHTVLAYSRSDYGRICDEMGVTFLWDSDDFCEEHPDVVVLCTSILSAESVLRSLPIQRLKRSTLFVDVLSVKEFPRNLFLQVLPTEFDVLCTHPMFGPESGKTSWAGLPFAFEKVRIGAGIREERCKKFLDIFEREGCRMVEISCTEHDRFAAGSQFITHTVGRVLGKLGLESTPINTKGYETLLNLVENTEGDSFDLYYGLFMYNINATEELERLELAFDSIKKQLFSQLHNVLRKQLFHGLGMQHTGKDQLVSSYPGALKGFLPLNDSGVEADNVALPNSTHSSEISSNGSIRKAHTHHLLQADLGCDAGLLLFLTH